MVGERGFEPPAPASRRQCSTRLSYSPTESGLGIGLGGRPVQRRRAIAAAVAWFKRLLCRSAGFFASTNFDRLTVNAYGSVSCRRLGKDQFVTALMQ